MLKKTAATTATELCAAQTPSAPRQLGRQLTLKFTGEERPELDRLEFQYKEGSPPSYWQRGDPEHNFSWTPVAQALALLFLDYLGSSERKTSDPFFFAGEKTGSLAATLGDAIYQPKHGIHDLFVQPIGAHGKASFVQTIFRGDNLHGKLSRARRISVNPDQLAPDCLEVFWEPRGPLPLRQPADLQTLAERIRKSLGLHPSSPTESGRGAGRPAAPPPAPLEVPEPAALPRSLSPATDCPNFPELRAHHGLIAKALAEGKALEQVWLLLKLEGVLTTTSRLEEYCQALASTGAALPAVPLAPPVQEPPAPPNIPPPTVRLPESFLKNLETIAALAVKAVRSSAPENTPAPPPPQGTAKPQPQVPPTPTPRFTRPAIPPIHPLLFGVFHPEGLAWEDSQPLLDFSEDERGADLWRLKDACEGVLILGAPGSGKTSASGFAFAQAFLTVGMGGLVLCAKPEEARRWQHLCARFGRAEDCIVVSPHGPHKLNLLAYETQRPREPLGLTDDLIAFFRVLMAIVGRRTSPQGKDDFWTNATNQLMRELFDLFLLAGEPLTIDGLTQFITHVPEQPRIDWPNLPVFGELLVRAEQAVANAADQRVYERVRDYWTAAYPRIAPQTRSGIVLGFTTMANALSGRGIYELISTDTTLTPELILSGKIVILDLPLKTCGQGGLLIQAAWKYLFERAIERRADKGLESARPVFLWEDEGHLFFSQHDIEFQPTARDCRAAHVILSQSLHNFYHLGHSPHAVQGVLAAINTQVFHANGDLETNKWASDKLGTAMKTQVNVSVASEPARGFWDYFKPPESKTTTSLNQHREKVFQPEEFALLKKGGAGLSQAVLLWVGHPFASNSGRPFKVTVFEQDPG